MDQTELEGLVNLVLCLTDTIVGVSDVGRDAVVGCLRPIPPFLEAAAGATRAAFTLELVRQAASYGPLVRDVVDALARKSLLDDSLAASA